MASVRDLEHYDSQRTPQPQAETPLRIVRAVYDALRAHGEEVFPDECCGILLGKPDEAGVTTVTEAIRAGNAREDSSHNRYQISAQELVSAQRKSRKAGLDIVGFYHSHPDHPAFWSSTDLQEAHWFGCSYVITSVDSSRGTPTAFETHSFLLNGSTEEDKAFATQVVEVA